jgi:hypothetical protein
VLDRVDEIAGRLISCCSRCCWLRHNVFEEERNLFEEEKRSLAAKSPVPVASAMKNLRAVALAICLAAACCAPSAVRAERVSLLNGKLKFDTTDAFVPKKGRKSSSQSIADYKARDSDGWGSVERGTHGLQQDGLANYMARKVADFTKGLSWLPRLNWLKKQIVTIDGRRWADMRFIAPRPNAKNARDGLMYTRIFGTSYKGQLLEIVFTSNTDPNPALKDKIDKIIASVRLEE